MPAIRKDYGERVRGDRWIFTEDMPAGCMDGDTILWMQIKQFRDTPDPGYGIASTTNLMAEALTDTSARFTFRGLETELIPEGDIWHAIKMYTPAGGVQTIYAGRLKVSPWTGARPAPPVLAAVMGDAEFSFETEGAFVVPPVTNAGPDQASFDLLGASPCQLAGSATGEGPITYLWTKVSGTPTVVFADATNPTTTCTFNTEGAVVLRLTATNSTGSQSDDVTITVGATLSALLTRMQSGSRAAAWWEVGLGETVASGNFTQLNDQCAGAYHMTSSGSNAPSKVAGGGPNGKDCMTFQDSARRMVAAGMSFASGKFIYAGGVFKVSGGYSSTSGNNNSPASNTFLVHAFGTSWNTWAVTAGAGQENKVITTPTPDASWHQFDTRYRSAAVVVTRVDRVAATPAFTGTGAAAVAVESVTFGHGNGASGSGGCSAYCQWMFEAVTTTAGSSCLSEQAAIDYYVTKQTAL